MEGKTRIAVPGTFAKLPEIQALSSRFIGDSNRMRKLQINHSVSQLTIYNLQTKSALSRQETMRVKVCPSYTSYLKFPRAAVVKEVYSFDANSGI